MRQFLVAIFALLLLAFPIAAQEANDNVFVRVTHFSVDAPEVDAYINGDLVLEAMSFPFVSDWIELEAGTYTFDIVATGDPVTDALLSADYDLSSGDWVTLAVIGELNRDTLAIQALVDDLNAIPEGEVFVSAFHAISDLAPVNVFVSDTELVRLLSYADASAELDGYASDTILAGDYGIDVQNSDESLLLTLEETTLGAGRAYFLALVGTAENPIFVFIPTDVDALTSNTDNTMEEVDTGNGTSMARIGHFSVSAGEVDIYLNSEIALENVQFGEVSDYIELDAGVYDVVLVPAGDSLANVAYEGQIALVADTLTLVAAIGFVGDESLSVVTATEDNDVPESGLTRIVFFQAVPSTALFNLSANNNTLMQGVTYPNVFEGASDGYVSVDIVAGAYEIVVEGGDSMLNIGNITTGSGRVYLVVSAGTVDAPVFFLISSDFPSEQ